MNHLHVIASKALAKLVLFSILYLRYQVGDLLRSMKLLVYKSDESKLEEIAVDISLNPVFLTAIEMIDDEVFLGADGRHLFICQKNR